MRERIYEIIEVDKEGDKASKVYDIFMMTVIVISIIPLMFKGYRPPWRGIDTFCVAVFIVDYLLRLWTADLKLKGKSHPFLRYPFTFMAIIDLLSILPSLIPVSRALKAFRLMRMVKMIRGFRLFRVFKALRYSKSDDIILAVIKDTKDLLLMVCGLAIGYIFMAALIIFNVEPETFDTFFEAVYWATMSLTAVGYGDIYPVTMAGRFVSMVSSIFGIAIVAMPAGIITAGYIEEVKRRNDRDDDEE